MLSPPPVATGTPDGRPYCAATSGCSCPIVLCGSASRGQGTAEISVFIDGRQHPFVPSSIPNIQQARTRSVAEFHHTLSGEVEIQIVVRQENGFQLVVGGGIVSLQPTNLGGGIAGQNWISKLAKAALCAAEPGCDVSAFLRGCCVAPELSPARVPRHFCPEEQSHAVGPTRQSLAPALDRRPRIAASASPRASSHHSASCSRLPVVSLSISSGALCTPATRRSAQRRTSTPFTLCVPISIPRYIRSGPSEMIDIALL